MGNKKSVDLNIHEQNPPPLEQPQLKFDEKNILKRIEDEQYLYDNQNNPGVLPGARAQVVDWGPNGINPNSYPHDYGTNKEEPKARNKLYDEIQKRKREREEKKRRLVE